MCGIAGIWNFNGEPVEEKLLEKATHTLANRGPDDSGVAIEGNIGFGHRRLSIIDLTVSGHQPMYYKDGSLMIVLNGEIYNYKELKKELEKKGEVFHSNSDTEVLLSGYRVWGPMELFKKCRGMWALGIWDKKNKKVILSRDRFGEKPLFFAIKNNKLIFASTLNALKILDDLPANIDLRAIDYYLNFGYIPTEMCIYENYEKCKPSHFLEIFENGDIKEHRYWEVKFQENNKLSLGEWKEKIEYNLKEAVKYTLVSDVPVSAFLSGGIDSTLVVAFALELGYTPKVFTMSAPNSTKDESERAKKFAKKYGLEHIIIPLDSRCYNVLPYLIKEFGEPYGDSSAIPAFYVAKKASKETKVILTGDGGDEVFSGYGRLNILNFYQKINQKTPKILKPFLCNLGRYLENNHIIPKSDGIGKRLKIFSGTLKDYFDAWKKISGWRKKILYGPKLRNLESYENPFDMRLKGNLYPEWIRNVLKIDMEVNLVGDFLTKIDTSCMATSLEGRCPYLDFILVEEVFKMPLNLWQLNGEPKGFLKFIAKERLPKDLLFAPKSGFSIPVEDYWNMGWFKLFEEIVFNGNIVKDGLLEKKGIMEIWKHFKKYKKNRENKLLYYILCLELWFRIVLNNESPESFVKI